MFVFQLPNSKIVSYQKAGERRILMWRFVMPVKGSKMSAKGSMMSAKGSMMPALPRFTYLKATTTPSSTLNCTLVCNPGTPYNKKSDLL